MHKLILPNLKLYLAFDSKDHYVLAKEVNSSPDAQWFCTACHCPLKLRNDVVSEEAWFVHNPDETTKELLAGCGYLNTEIKRLVFMRRLRSILNNLDTLGTIRFWYCVWCRDHYKGEKHCKTCNTGIYSISRGDWTWNYNQKEDTSEISSHGTINIKHHHQTACKPF
ncbi:putative zinc ribbon protein [Serratia sp. ASV30]|uniref:putative zinc ribbon protein n=1 Tax=Serratia sp. ASV30 TaxID=2795127 RepID=UPI0018EA8CF7|nr:putative zinc ribbon protein [Serratia sp. ASV30]